MSYGIVTWNFYNVFLSKGKKERNQTINKCMYMIVWAINTTRVLNQIRLTNHVNDL
jgi:hypothetical protein